MGSVTDEERQRHQRWVFNYFSAKVDEFSYRLEEIVSACDTSLVCALTGQKHPEETGKIVTYGFSAFSNLVQTLKDSASFFLGAKITWEPIKALRHGQFLYMSRNAATHDGNPIISGWSNGRFYVPSDIRRLDKDGRLVVIAAPMADIRTVCLEFSADFANLLLEHLSEVERASFLQGSLYDHDEVASFIMESHIVPQFAKDLFAQNAEQIKAAASACRFSPVKDSAAKLSTLAHWCEARLALNGSPK